MKNMKYIVFERTGFREFVIFSGTLSHKEIARDILGPLAKDKVVSAGFVDFKESPTFFGESESLGVKSDPDKDRQTFDSFNRDY